MPEQLNVEIRDCRGKHPNRRLRKAGQIPGVLYGHRLENVCLAVSADRLSALVQHGARLVTLAGGVSESAFIREIQWDTWGTRILHVDFTRVSEHELLQVEVPLELRGEAAGVKEGGVVEQLLHQVRIECPASVIPEKLLVRINSLKLGEAITLGDVELPPGARVLADPTSIVVQCSEPAPELEEVAAEAGPAEPEVIGAKPKEEEEEES